MKETLTIQLLSIFIATISMAVVPAILSANATIVNTPGTSPNTLWIGSGPASDSLQLHYYSSEIDEYNALCFDVDHGLGCANPSIDLTDVPIPPFMYNAANYNNPQFYVTPLSPIFDFDHVDFNLANSFFGVEFCNGANGVTSASTCPDGPGATPIPATCPGTTYHSAIGAPDCTAAAIALR